MSATDLIGFILPGPGFPIACQTCHLHGATRPSTPIRLYKINILPYSQCCHFCGKDLVVGQFSTQLYEPHEKCTSKHMAYQCALSKEHAGMHATTGRFTLWSSDVESV